jgi:hypothetical protein
MVKRLTPNPAAIRATDGIGVLAGPTGSRSPMRDGTDGDKYKPLDSARLLSEVRHGHPTRPQPARRSARRRLDNMD